MRYPVLLWKLNNRNVELHAEARHRQVVGVRQRDGDYRFVTWLGFIAGHEARRLAQARSVKLKIARVGMPSDVSTEWRDIRSGHIQGCLVEHGAYAVLDLGVREVGVLPIASTSRRRR